MDEIEIFKTAWFSEGLFLQPSSGGWRLGQTHYRAAAVAREDPAGDHCARLNNAYLFLIILSAEKAAIQRTCSRSFFFFPADLSVHSTASHSCHR